MQDSRQDLAWHTNRPWKMVSRLLGGLEKMEKDHTSTKLWLSATV